MQITPCLQYHINQWQKQLNSAGNANHHSKSMTATARSTKKWTCQSRPYARSAGCREGWPIAWNGPYTCGNATNPERTYSQFFLQKVLTPFTITRSGTGVDGMRLITEKILIFQGHFLINSQNFLKRSPTLHHR